MQFTLEAHPPLGIVFDCDFGNSIDTALALALLYGFDGKREARVVSVSISNPNLKAAELADVIVRFYAGFRVLPIGLYAEGKWARDTAMVSAPLAMQHEDGTPVFASNIKKLNDTADPAALIRNGLTAQHDQNCTIVLAGPACNLVALLTLHGTKELITSKVRLLVATEAAYTLPSSKRFFSEWPTAIVIVPDDVGTSVLYPGASIEKDYSWSPAHPVAAAYRAVQSTTYDAKTTSMAAVLYAVHPDAAYFRLSDPGTIQIGNDGRASFLRSADGKHRKLALDATQKDSVLKLYTELSSAKPVPRPRPGAPKVDEAKPEKAAEK